ncbi:hypothetical protein HN51_24735 [Ectopseudomonas mendocina]|uniref:Secreted protein n=1 Tax=Ectopseudomonas mendocina S5.2 TaxID=1225174 RepID=A0ABN4J1Q3_ECTME|nr:hypothetical protein DW68_024960 [Pseudomonas mendocina S5.2]KER98016.1 hypothetical protein HN51_24735 [Pseudomonas mendocina]OEO24556.1 hypothetical protein AX279_17990 [Pseudomonas sp. J237]
MFALRLLRSATLPVIKVCLRGTARAHGTAMLVAFRAIANCAVTGPTTKIASTTRLAVRATKYLANPAHSGPSSILNAYVETLRGGLGTELRHSVLLVEWLGRGLIATHAQRLYSETLA